MAGTASCDLDAAGSQAANGPVLLRRVIEPWLDPALVDTAPYGAFVEALALPVEEWQPPLRLIQPAPQVGQLGCCRALAPCRETQHTRSGDTIFAG